MKTALLILVAGIAMTDVAAGADWLTYCVERDGTKVVTQSKTFWKNLTLNGNTVSLVTSKRLKHLQATCESGLEPICYPTVGANPAKNDAGETVVPYPAKPLSHTKQWRYDFVVKPHVDAHWCLYVSVER